MSKKEESVFIKNICRRMVIGAMSQLLLEQLDEMQIHDTAWKNKLKNVGNNFVKELDKEVNRLLAVKIADEQLLKLTNIIEDEMKDIYTHVEQQVIKIVENEKNNPEEVHKEV